MNLFYVKPEDVELPYLNLGESELRHVSRVLRYRVGDQLFVTDGKGSLFKTKIVEIGRDRGTLKVIETKFEELEKPWISLCMGLIKKRDRLEFAVEKAVELGVNEIIIFRGSHSQKENIRADRLEATVLSAMKQSFRYYLPGVRLMASLKKVFETQGEAASVVVADETTENTSLTYPFDEKEAYLLVVGPEGGFSREEREVLKERDSHHYSLGEKRLRTETAAMIMVERFRNGVSL